MSMTTYEIIDTFCDAINPLLLLMCLSLCVSYSLNKKYRVAFTCFGLLMVLMVLVYGSKFLDDKLLLWHRFGGDFSTHLAFALVCCVFLFRRLAKPTIWIFVAVIYGLLMWYQKYHTVYDMLTTAVWVLPLAFTMSLPFGQKKEARISVFAARR